MSIHDSRAPNQRGRGTILFVERVACSKETDSPGPYWHKQWDQKACFAVACQYVLFAQPYWMVLVCVFLCIIMCDCRALYNAWFPVGPQQGKRGRTRKYKFCVLGFPMYFQTTKQTRHCHIVKYAPCLNSNELVTDHKKRFETKI